MRLLLTLPFALALLAPPASAQNLQPQYSTVFGGSGGTTFTRECGAGRVMAGIRGRDGLVVDAIGLICRQVAANGTLGPPSAVGTLVGGNGGTAREVVCPRDRPVMVGFTVSAGTYVDALGIICAEWTPATRSWDKASETGSIFGRWNPPGRMFTCGSNRQPMTGLRGRANALVDAIGVKCNEP